MNAPTYQFGRIIHAEAQPCEMSGCTHPGFSRCTKCNRQVCGSHAEDCECCAKTYCPTCYKEHAEKEETY